MHRNRRINRRTAEELLRGEALGRSAAPDPLADLLAAAAAPTRDGELVGEKAALAAFRSASSVPTADPRRESMLKTTIGKVLTAKAAAVAGALAASGVAVAAGTGHLPSVSGNDHPVKPTHAPASPHQSQGASEHATGAPDGKGGAGNNGDSEHGANPSPSLVGLCNAYNRGVAESSGKALENPAFQVLIEKAGGKDKVGQYCVTVLKDDKGEQDKPDSHPTGRPDSAGDAADGRSDHGDDSDKDSGSPEHDGKPTAAPTDHPTGQPTSAPTERPTPQHTS